GIPNKIRGDNAIEFAKAFYRALGFGESVKRAVEQGYVALTMEGVPEADQPQLHVRAGVDAAQVFLVPGDSNRGIDTSFQVPVRPTGDFLGRESELASLRKRFVKGHARPARIGLTGMGGIGKTRIAYEYAWRNRDLYTDGIFWISGTSPLPEGFAQVGKTLRPEARERTLDAQVHACFEELKQKPNSLLIVDNLVQVADLFGPTFFESFHPGDLPCQILFT